jgi:hypothetical protein
MRTKEWESGTPQTRLEVQQTLQRWQCDPNLAALRDETALMDLPEAEQEACRKLWAEVTVLLKQARGKE